MALLGIPSGSLIARLGARSTMLVSDAVRAPLIALVPLLHWSGHLTLRRCCSCSSSCSASSRAPYVASQRSIVPELFGDDERLGREGLGAASAARPSCRS